MQKENSDIKTVRKKDFAVTILLWEKSDMNNYVIRLVFAGPDDPAIDAHDSVIQVHAGLAIQAAFYTQVDIYDGIISPTG